MATAAPVEEISIMPPATAAAIEANKPKTVPVKLKRNYRPRGEYEVVGFEKEEIVGKNAAGQTIVIEKGGFIKEDEDDEANPNFGKRRPAPPPLQGVGSGQKVWAGTVIKVPVDEAKTMRKAGIAEIEIDD